MPMSPMIKWGYKDNNGPSHWHELGFPISTSGTRQSPIDIATAKAQDDPSLKGDRPIKWSYPSNCCTDIENTGASWKVNVVGDNTSLTGGPLASGDEYRLWQFHAHWGKDNDRGAEHTVDGKNYAGEIHFVHWNTKYGSPRAAVAEPDGLCVLGRFFEVGDESNDDLDRVVSILPKIEMKNQKASFDQDQNAEGGMPKPDVTGMLQDCQNKPNYWTYLGSLTTPPLAECVIWVVFKEPLKVTERQLEVMRSLVVEEGCDCEDRIIDNFRPPQPLKERVIRSCNCD